MERLRRVFALVLKEFLALLKDPKSRAVVIGPPFLQFFVFGYAATFDVDQVLYAVLDQSRTPSSREFLAELEGSSAFELVRTLESPDQIREVLDPLDATLVVHIGPDFERRLAVGDTAAVQVIADGRNANVAAVATGYVSRIVAAASARQAGGASGPRIELVDRSWFTPNLPSRWTIVTPLAATIAMVVVLLVTSLSVAREREFGTFDQLLVAPFGATEILVGKSVPAVVFGMLDGLLLSLGGVFWFGVPFRGSILALLATLLVFIVAIVGVGLLISSISTTMQQGLLGAFVFIMPSTTLSGFTTPIENMPGWLQTLTYANPLRYAVASLRRIFLEGSGLADVWPQLWPMAAIAAVARAAPGWVFPRRAG